MSASGAEEVLNRLRSWRDDTTKELPAAQRAEHEEALGRKLALDRAIACLELCERYRIDPSGPVIVLPAQGTQTPSSEFRVIEDHESDDPSHWEELKARGHSLRPLPGDVILRPRD